MKRELTIGKVRQRGLGPPAGHRNLGLTVMIVGAARAVIAMVSIGAAR